MTRKIVSVLLALAGALILAACNPAPAGVEPVDTGSDGGAGGDASGDATREPLMDRAGLAGQTYQGEVLPPQSGFGILRIYEDNTLDILVVINDRPDLSYFLKGELTNQRIAATAEYGQTRVSGVSWSSGGGFDLNLTLPGVGVVRVPVQPVEELDLFKGEANDYTAGLMMTTEGDVLGIAAVEGGDEPIFEFLCVDGDVEAGGEVVATTCDSGEEVTLTSAVGEGGGDE